MFHQALAAPIFFFFFLAVEMVELEETGLSWKELWTTSLGGGRHGMGVGNEGGELPAPPSPLLRNSKRNGCPRLGRERTAGREVGRGGAVQEGAEMVRESAPGELRELGHGSVGHVRWGVLRCQWSVGCGGTLCGQGLAPGRPLLSYWGTPRLSALNSQAIDAPGGPPSPSRAVVLLKEGCARFCGRWRMLGRKDRESGGGECPALRAGSP